jgi:pyridoxamine 5'-phosphate oxidase
VRLPLKTAHYHGAMSESFRQLLRALPDFPENLPDFDPAAAPANPAQLFRDWLAEALAAGEPQPHVCSLATLAGSVVELSAEASAADWSARPAADGSHNPDWQLYAIQPQEIEFWQARHDRRHVRHHYGPGPEHSLR